MLAQYCEKPCRDRCWGLTGLHGDPADRRPEVSGGIAQIRWRLGNSGWE